MTAPRLSSLFMSQSPILRKIVPNAGDKPYRVYRQPRRVRGDGSIPWDTPRGSKTPGSGTPPRRNTRRDRLGWRLFRYARRLSYVIVALIAVWSGVAYWSFRSAVHERNLLVPAKVHAVLSPADGPLLSHAHNILLLGSDTRGKNDAGRTDSMILMRMDIKRRRYAMLSIPRDLRVPIDGLGEEKINSAYSNGGAALTIKTVAAYTGVDINHYMLIDFRGFRTLIDEIGGVTVSNPRAIRSNSFDGKVWEFKKGRIHLTGRRALAYSRVRKNELDPSESDLTRGRRQQAVLAAIGDKVVSTNSLLHPRDIPEAMVQPLITDVTASQLILLGVGKSWAKRDNVLNCRLGGDIDFIDGQSVIVGDEANRATVRMWLGEQPPRRPNLLENQFAPGCMRAGAKPPEVRPPS